MYKIRYADVSDARVMGEIHSKSWKIAYKNIGNISQICMPVVLV